MEDLLLNSDIKDQINLPLAALGDGSPGITPAFGRALAEAAAVCLTDQGHVSPTAMDVRGALKAEGELTWQPPNDQTVRCWADEEVATEHGAYGVATILLLETSTLQVVERSKKGTGFDYWLGDKDDVDLLFQGKARLEVSGIRHGNESTVTGRMKRKLRQTERSDGSIPAMVIIIEFSRPQSRVAYKCGK